MLTFEKIRDLERAERDNKQLQKLPETLMDQIQEYLRKKETMKQSSSDIMELENVKNTIKRFFELREKKLMEAVLYTVKTGMPAQNVRKDEEKVVFAIVDDLKKNRETFFSELQKEPAQQQEKKTFYKVVKSLPTFVGPDMNTYKLNENDKLLLEAVPKPLNDFLLKKGIIEKVEE